MKRLESLAIELGMLEGKEQGIKEVDHQLTKIFKEHGEDLSPECGHMVNDIVTMLHKLRIENTHDINKHIIIIGATLNKKTDNKKGLDENDLKEINELARKLAGGR